MENTITSLTAPTIDIPAEIYRDAEPGEPGIEQIAKSAIASELALIDFDYTVQSCINAGFISKNSRKKLRAKIAEFMKEIAGLMKEIQTENL